ncbi:MAG: type II toxin-antitoxin system RelE/ParE family toxin [Gammaproteobacteria bacterium]|nr:type II toxin-antitoxin system RelE/ParE family toxin [Gammaproteobacteria bacterium]
MDKTEVLNELPHIGHAVPEIDTNSRLRELSLYSYRILYEVINQDIPMKRMEKIPPNQDTPSIPPCRLDSSIPAADGLGWGVSFPCDSVIYILAIVHLQEASVSFDYPLVVSG